MKNREEIEQWRAAAYDYTYGLHGRPHDGVKAAALYQRCVDAGDRKAMGAMAYFYLLGIFVAKDAARAVRLYEESIKDQDGCESCLNDLASCYETGEGTSQNLTRARTLYARAAALGSKLARKALVRLRTSRSGSGRK